MKGQDNYYLRFDMADSRAKLNASLMDLAKRYAAEAIEQLGDQIVSIALYGSVARGEAGPGSDIDLFVVLANAPLGMLNRRRLLDPVRESLTPELSRLWEVEVYVDFVEVIRTRSEAEKFHPLYLDMSQEAVLLYDSDRFLEGVLAEVGEELERRGAERRFMGNFWFWDLSGASSASSATSASSASDSSRLSTPDEVAEP